MDSLSQILLGAAVGESVLGKKVGNKAPLWGAIAGTIPDLDVFVARSFDVVTELSIHRGFSHSIVFSILAAPLLALLVKWIYKRKTVGNLEWTKLFFLALITHPLLDCFTTWGTQLFWPLPHRIAFHSIFVIDPLYTLPLLITVLTVLFMNRKSPRRAAINKWGLIISSIYLFSTLLNKMIINSTFEQDLKKQGISYLELQTRPAPFSTILWSANVERKDDFLLGYYSYLDDRPTIAYSKIPKQHELLYPYRNNDDVEKLLDLTKGYYTVTKDGEDVLINDLRFGMTEGWNSKGDFVFQYRISTDANGNTLISKKDNVFKNAGNLVSSWWERLKGR